MQKIFTLLLLFVATHVFSQTETHNFVTYDTAYNGVYGQWLLRISRPVNMWTAGNADTASRPALITMPGLGEMGSTDTNNLVKYGPHYWLNNGWDGGITLGNGKHYPILITVTFTTNSWPSPEGGADVLSYILSHYHIKANGVHLGGLSMGAFTWTGLIAFEQTAGAETGMKMATSIVALEGFTTQQDSPFSGWSRDVDAYGVWASKYHGKFFGLEGYNDYRNVAAGEKAMNAVVPGSAYFAYENLGSGAHCCWNSMYDPSVHNWQSFSPYGTYVTTATDTNSRGTYKTGSSIFEWMLRQGDTTLVGAASTPSTGSSASLSSYTTIPATIEAESYSAMNGISTQTTSDAGGGVNVDYIDNGDWMDYPISVSKAGSFVLNLRVATINTGGTLQVLNSAGTVLSDVSIPNTGNWQTWTTLSTTLTLPAGDQTVRIYNNGKVEWNINWLQFVTAAAAAIPGTIEAENYTAMSGVQTQTTSDVSGAQNVGWIDTGDWMTYNVSVATSGVYSVDLRVANPNTGSALQLINSSGTVLNTVTLPNTGGFQNWVTVTTLVNLSSGVQTLKVYNSGESRWNINWMKFDTTEVKPIPGTIQAENYDAMNSIATETTTDTDGGLDVGWIDHDNWMSYNVNVASAGTYTVNLRVASPYNAASLQLLNGTGDVLGTLSVKNTGGYQKWVTMSMTVTLPAGNQTLKLNNNGNVQWNVNWMQFVSGTTTTQTSTEAVSNRASLVDADSINTVAANFLRLYPNPARDQVTLILSNAHSGPVRVTVSNLLGGSLQTYEFNKTSSTLQAQLAVGHLAAGLYIVRIQGSDWSETRKIEKW